MTVQIVDSVETKIENKWSMVNSKIASGVVVDDSAQNQSKFELKMKAFSRSGSKPMKTNPKKSDLKLLAQCKSMD